MNIAVKFSESQQRINLKFQSYIGITTDADPYTGVYEATPTNSVQVFETATKMMGKNFVVNPIPKEYGLITYDQDRIITIT